MRRAEIPLDARVFTLEGNYLNGTAASSSSWASHKRAMPFGQCAEPATVANGLFSNGALPASTCARASVVSALRAASAPLFSAMAVCDVSSQVRIAAAGNDALPLSALRSLA